MKLGCRPRGALSALALFMAGWLVVVFGVNILLVVAYMLVDNPDKPPLSAIDFSFLPSFVLPLTLTLQFAGMAALIPLTRLAIGKGFAPDVLDEPLSRTLAMRPSPSLLVWPLALVIGFTMGWLPGWIASQLRELIEQLFPALDLGTIEMINDLLRTGSLPVRVAMAVLIALVAPLVEELVFRGYFWSALRRRFSEPATWILTSVVFAAYHMDPIQGTALLFSAFALGWVRWQTRSIWPGVLVHAVNNALGVATAYITTTDAELSFLPALIGAGVALASGGALYVVCHRTKATPAD